MKSETFKETPRGPEPIFLGGTVQLIPSRPMATQFICPNHSWLFPMHCLEVASMGANPQHKEESDIPPDELTLRYTRATVLLRGWRLETVLDAFGEVRVGCVHAEEKPATLPAGEPWVSEIHVTEDPEEPEPTSPL